MSIFNIYTPEDIEHMRRSTGYTVFSQRILCARVFLFSRSQEEIG